VDFSKWELLRHTCTRLRKIYISPKKIFFSDGKVFVNLIINFRVNNSVLKTHFNEQTECPIKEGYRYHCVTNMNFISLKREKLHVNLSQFKTMPVDVHLKTSSNELMVHSLHQLHKEKIIELCSHVTKLQNQMSVELHRKFGKPLELIKPRIHSITSLPVVRQAFPPEMKNSSQPKTDHAPKIM